MTGLIHVLETPANASRDEFVGEIQGEGGIAILESGTYEG